MWRNYPTRNCSKGVEHCLGAFANLSTCITVPALIEKDFSSSCHSEIRRARTSSIVLSGRRSSLHPDPSIDTKTIEESFVEDEFSNIPLKQLIFRRLILLFVMLGIFVMGLMFRLFLPASSTRMLDINSDYNVTTAVTTQL